MLDAGCWVLGAWCLGRCRVLGWWCWVLGVVLCWVLGWVLCWELSCAVLGWVGEGQSKSLAVSSDACFFCLLFLLAFSCLLLLAAGSSLLAAGCLRCRPFAPASAPNCSLAEAPEHWRQARRARCVCVFRSHHPSRQISAIRRLVPARHALQRYCRYQLPTALALSALATRILFVISSRPLICPSVPITIKQ